jgi:hypothetical protein
LSQAVKGYVQDSIACNRNIKSSTRRISRPLAECITNEEVVARMAAAAEIASKKKEEAVKKKRAAQLKQEAAKAKALERKEAKERSKIVTEIRKRHQKE